MRNSSLRALPSLLLVGLWATEVAAQTWTAQPTETTEAGRSVASAPSDTADTADTAASSPARKCSLEVRSAQSRGSKSFSATQILDLDFHVRLDPKRASEQLVRVEIETPTGHLFQTLTVPFSDEPSQAGTRRAVDGFPRPVAVQMMRTVTGKAGTTVKEVVARLPVAGTPIVHSSLYGEWTATVYLDDEIEPCGRSRAFSIRP